MFVSLTTQSARCLANEAIFFLFGQLISIDVTKLKETFDDGHAYRRLWMKLEQICGPKK